jgi:hypothetical protein
MSHAGCLLGAEGGCSNASSGQSADKLVPTYVANCDAIDFVQYGVPGTRSGLGLTRRPILYMFLVHDTHGGPGKGLEWYPLGHLCDPF